MVLRVQGDSAAVVQNVELCLKNKTQNPYLGEQVPVVL